MNFKIGDKVKFLNDVGEGTVSAIIDKKTVMVSSSDGFDIPVLAADLIKSESGQGPQKREPAPAEEAVLVSIDEPVEDTVPVDDEIVLAIRVKNSSDMTPFLINMSGYHLYYTVAQKTDGDHYLLSGGQLEPETMVKLPKIVPRLIDENVSLSVNLIFFGKSFYIPIAPLNRKIDILPSDIYSGFLLHDNEYFEGKAAIFPVYQFKKKDEEFTNKTVSGDLKKILAEKEGKPAVEKQKKESKKEELVEVDLHIQNITDNYSELSNGEILEIQLARFKTSLDTAIIHGTRRIVFIHGIGNGKLKHELRKKLDQNYPDLKYQDASFKEYGYGATMVIC